MGPCMVQFDSVRNLAYMRRHNCLNCQRLYMKSKGFLHMLLPKIFIICFHGCLIISWELDVNLYCYVSPQSPIMHQLHYRKSYQCICNMTTMFHILVTNY